MTKLVTSPDLSALPDKDVLSPGEVALAFGVNGKTVTRWADLGKIPSFRTLGGHRRFHRDDLMDALRDVR